ncbi:MAG: hypothetical protein ACOC3I_05900 [Verrucomicrobiota bacterium]
MKLPRAWLGVLGVLLGGTQVMGTPVLPGLQEARLSEVSEVSPWSPFSRISRPVLDHPEVVVELPAILRADPAAEGAPALPLPVPAEPGTRDPDFAATLAGMAIASL